MSQEILYLITFETYAQSLEIFTKQMESVKTELPKVEGCMGVEILGHEDSNKKFTLVERWSSKAAHQEHVQRLQESGEWEKIEAMLAKLPEGTYAYSL